MGKKSKAKMQAKIKAKINANLQAGAALINKRQLKKEMKQLRRKNIHAAIERRNNSLLPIDWSLLNLPPIKKDIYEEYVQASNMSTEKVEMYRKDRGIIVNGIAPNPITSFKEVSFPTFCMEKILTNYKEPTPVQSQIWPIAMRGHNVVCLANDDKGITLAYLLPAITHIRAQPPPTAGEGSIVLILCPNNQSAEKIKAEVEEYTSGDSISCMCLVTGISKKKQIQDVARGFHIIIGTPSHVSSLLIDGHINFKRCTFVVLNEPDRMLNSGVQVMMVLGQIRPDRQILMLGPTMPVFRKEFVGDHIEISVTTELIESSVIKQHVNVCMEIDKGPKLKEILLRIYEDQQPLRRGKIIIFVATKRRVDKVRKFITSFLEYCSAIHSDKHKIDRTLMLKDFDTGKSNILITTDMSDRDIIVDKVMYLINFDHPLEPKNYLRRLRRIDPGMPGHAFTFFTRKDALFAQNLIDDLHKTGQFVSKGLLHMARLGSDPTKNSMPKYYPRMKSGLMFHKKNLPHASGKSLADGSDSFMGNDVLESGTESDAEDCDPYKSAGGIAFESRQNDSVFESKGGGSGYGSNSSNGFGNKRDNKNFGGCGLRAGGSGLHAGGGAGFGIDTSVFRKSSSASEFRSEVGASGIRAWSGSGISRQNVGLYAGGGAGFGNMGDNTEFNNRGVGIGFDMEEDRGCVTTEVGGRLGNMCNVTGFGGNDGVRFTACDNIGNGSKDAGNVRGMFSLDNGNHFGNIRDVCNIGGGTEYHNRGDDAACKRKKFAADREHNRHGDHDMNRRNDEYFSNNFGDYGGLGEVGGERFQQKRNDNFGGRGINSNSGDIGNGCYGQGNGGFGAFTGSAGFAERGGDRIKGNDSSDWFGNRNYGNFRDDRGDAGYRNEKDNFNKRDDFVFNNRSDNDFNRRGGFKSTEATLFTRRDARHFDNRSFQEDYSGGHESNRNKPYNPHSGGGRGRSSGYGR